MAHGAEERDQHQGGSASVGSEQLLDVIGLWGQEYMRVEVKGACLKHLNSPSLWFLCGFVFFFSDAYYLPFVLSSMPGLLCFYLLGLQPSASTLLPVTWPCSFGLAARLPFAPALLPSTHVHTRRGAPCQGTRGTGGSLGWEHGGSPRG